MAKESKRQKEIVGRVMHEFKHGELETQGRKVRNPRQAIAIGLSEAGASRTQGKTQNKRSRARTDENERKGQTGRQVKRDGTGGRRSAKANPAKRSKPSAPSSRARSGERTRAELYAEAQRRGLTGRSRLSKAELERALQRR